MCSNYLISFIRIFFMNICTSYSFIKIKGCKKIEKNKQALLIIFDILIGIVGSILIGKTNKYIHPIFINIFSYIIYIYLSIGLVKELDKNFLVVMFTAMTFSFTFFFISTMIPFSIKSMPNLKIQLNVIHEYILTGIIQLIIAYLFFKIKRFKKGFSFVKDDKLSKNITLIFLILSIIIVEFIIFSVSKNISFNKAFANIMIIELIYLLYLIKESITKHYKLKMKDRTVELLNEQIGEKDKEIIELKEELAKVHKINHKYNHRISAMEKAVSKLKFSEEFSKENGDIIELVENLSKEYKEELNTLDGKENQVKTGITGVDNILDYMCQEAQKNNIEIKTEANCDLKGIINILPESKLETMLADHINDAIIAINFSKNSNRKILITFDKTDNIYQIKIYDTGIEFEIETLLKLGLEQTTTHKETGRKRNRIYYNI